MGCLLLASLLSGQFETAEVLGTVRDASGGTIPKASVTLVNQNTGIQAKTITDEDGNYDFFHVPSLWQSDLAVNKNFRIPVREGTTLQFRSEFFNVLNHTNFTAPNCDITSSALGTIRSTYSPRQIQLALKLLF